MTFFEKSLQVIGSQYSFFDWRLARYGLFFVILHRENHRVISHRNRSCARHGQGYYTMEKSLKSMSAEEFRQAKPEHLARRSAMPKYADRGIRFVDVMVEPGGRYRYDIETVTGVRANRITIHEINCMLGISTEREGGSMRYKHDEQLLLRLRQYQEKFSDFCKYIKANAAKWDELPEMRRRRGL